MSRPVGVTVSAIVAILGSIFALLTSALMVASLFMGTTQPQPPNSAKFAFASAVMFAALAGFGIWTSVGLFRLRSWARVSILVFAVFLVAMCAFSLLLTMAVPIPAEYSGSTEHTFRVMMAAMFGIPLAIAVWWLVQFNTQSTKAAFASPTAEAPSRRPMSITVIAWTLIVGAVFCLIPILIRMPAFLFGATFTGWIASVIYALFGALSLYMGKGCSICGSGPGYWRSVGSDSGSFMRALWYSCRLCGNECSSYSGSSRKISQPRFRSIAVR
jgi:hypothetical protein